MRPQAVTSAEAAYLASVAMMVALAWLTWDRLAEVAGVGAAFGVNAMYIGLTLLLLILAVRRSSRVAMWALVALSALNLIGLAKQIWDGTLTPGLLGLMICVHAALTLAGAVLLLRPRARDWFGRSAHTEEDEA